MHRLLRISSVAISVSIFTLFWGGCAGLWKRLEPPRINISNIQVKEVKGLESVFQVELRVFNTNDIPIVIKGMDCEITINDRRFASGVSNKETSIPSYGTETVPIFVYSSVLDIFKGVLGLQQNREKLKYQIKGKVRVDAGSLSPSTIPFQSEGELSLDKVIP
jgi:LEA14-like dessication related protein